MLHIGTMAQPGMNVIMTEPVALPADFNPTTNLFRKTTEFGDFHESRRGARFAAELVANGTPADLTLAEKVLDAVLACQELDKHDPHYGNFYWMAEDRHVEDLNAVEFNLESLIPMMIRHSERLAPTYQARVKEAIRFGLAEIARLDVLIAYTNITVLDILNSCLGGELLGDKKLAERGYAKLVAWMAYTNTHGHPLEYNSPTYGAVTIRALKRLIDLVQDEATRANAQAMIDRLAVSIALHIHPPTGRWVGPHGRAYQPSVMCETAPEIEMVRSWIADGTVPAEIGGLLDKRPATFQVTETAERDRNLAITTYHTPHYALGTATSSFNPQANVCMAHYTRAGADRPGVLYTRYITNDKWFGDAYHATDRTKTRNLPDEGDFYSVQQGSRALAVYSSANFRHGHSAKAVLIWTQRAAIDEIWVGSQRVETLPHTVAPDRVIVIGSGGAYIAVRPLELTPLGKHTPIQLVERNGDLVLEMYNYQGPEKRFWELNWPGAFYQGKPIAAFYLEMADRSGYDSGAIFGGVVNDGKFVEHLDRPFTYAATNERIYSAAYQRDQQEIGLEIDLMQWQLKRRWTDRGDLSWPALETDFTAALTYLDRL